MSGGGGGDGGHEEVKEVGDGFDVGVGVLGSVSRARDLHRALHRSRKVVPSCQLHLVSLRSVIRLRVDVSHLLNEERVEVLWGFGGDSLVEVLGTESSDG